MALILDLLEQLPLEDLERVDTVCDAFVSAWRRDETPRIEDFVAAATESLQRLTVLELIRTEIEFRRAAGERPSASEYEARFPQWSHELQTLVAELLVTESLRSLENTEHLWAKDTDASGEFRVPSATPVPATSSKSEVTYDRDGLPADRRLGDYQIQDILGRGGMGIVVRARDTKLERDVAIKLLAPELARHDVAKQRFLREARAAAAVRHDNVVTIHSVDEADGLPFLVMELIHGESLAERLQRDGPLPVTEIAWLAWQIALGLDAAHRRGLVHRDIKPANILLEQIESPESRVQSHEPDLPNSRLSTLDSRLRIKITDFGLARVTAEARITQPGFIAGTPQYMSPEQARGEPLDHRTDLFSLGSVMYAMCTGHAAFQAETVVVTLRQVSDITPSPIQVINPDIPRWLIEIIDRLMAKRREDRFESAVEVAELLRKDLDDRRMGTLARPEEKAGLEENRRARVPILRRAITALAGFAVLLTTLAVFVIRTGDGVYELTTDDLAIAARLAENGGIVVEDQRTKQQYTLKRGPNRLPSGHYELTVSTPAGLFLDTPKFQIRRGDTVVATVTAQAAETPKTNLQTATSGSGRSSSDISVLSDWQWTEPEKLGPEVNSGSGDFLPSLSTDELTMIFASRRSGGHGQVDLWQTTRANIDEPWQTPENLGPLINTWDVESAPYLSADGLTLLFDSPKEHPDALGQDDLWSCTRKTKEDAWSEPQPAGRNVNSAHRDWNGSLSQDGLTLFFASDRPGGLGGMDLWMAVRPALDQPFGTPQSLGRTINSPAVEYQPKISADGRALLFVSDRRGSIGELDLWMAVRTDAKADWSAATNLGPTINRRNQRVSGMALSADGQTLFMSHNDFGTKGALWLTRRIPKSRTASRPWSDRNVALEFDGQKSHVDLPVPFEGTGDLTVEAWVTPQKFNDFGSVIHSPGAAIRLTKLTFDGKEQFGFTGHLAIHADDHKEAAIGWANRAEMTVGQRTHIALVRRGQDARLYVDGRGEGAPVGWSAIPNTPAPQNAGFELEISQWRLGADTGGLFNTFTGAIDEVRISKIARYEKNFTPASRFELDEHTLGLYRIDQGEGDELKDASDHDRHGKIVDAKSVKATQDAQVNAP